MPSDIESWLGECAFRNRVMVRGMCLQNDTHGYGNVRSKRESGYGNVLSEIESWLGECAIRNRDMVMGMYLQKRVRVKVMCHKKEIHG